MLYQHCKEKLPKIAKNSLKVQKGQKSAQNSQKSSKMVKNGTKTNQKQFKLCFISIIKKILIFKAPKLALAYQIIYVSVFSL